MRIFIPTQGLEPGAVGSEDHTHAIISLLARRGHQLTVAGPNQQALEGVSGDVEWRPLLPPDPPPSVLWRASDPLRVYHAWRTFAALGDPRWDVTLSGLLPPLCASRLRWPGVPRVYVPHSVLAPVEIRSYELVRSHELVSRITYYWLQRWAWRYADAVISASATAAALRTHYYRGAPRRLVVSPFGADTERFRPRPRDLALLAELGIPTDAPLAVSVGRLVLSKDLPFLLESFAQLTTPNAHLLIVGDGPKRRELEQLAERLGIAARVRFAGFQQCVERYLALGDVYVTSSRLESFGLTVVQAMACALPVVARRARYPEVLSACPELIDEAKTGYLGDTQEEFAAHLDRLLSSPDRARQMGAHARRMAVARFSWERHADDVERVLITTVERLAADRRQGL